jgi:hypothetical protein
MRGLRVRNAGLLMLRCLGALVLFCFFHASADYLEMDVNDDMDMDSYEVSYEDIMQREDVRVVKAYEAAGVEEETSTSGNGGGEGRQGDGPPGTTGIPSNDIKAKFTGLMSFKNLIVPGTVLALFVVYLLIANHMQKKERKKIAVQFSKALDGRKYPKMEGLLQKHPFLTQLDTYKKADFALELFYLRSNGGFEDCDLECLEDFLQTAKKLDMGLEKEELNGLLNKRKTESERENVEDLKEVSALNNGTFEEILTPSEDSGGATSLEPRAVVIEDVLALDSSTGRYGRRAGSIVQAVALKVSEKKLPGDQALVFLDSPGFTMKFIDGVEKMTMESCLQRGIERDSVQGKQTYETISMQLTTQVNSLKADIKQEKRDKKKMKEKKKMHNEALDVQETATDKRLQSEKKTRDQQRNMHQELQMQKQKQHNEEAAEKEREANSQWFFNSVTIGLYILLFLFFIRFQGKLANKLSANSPEPSLWNGYGYFPMWASGSGKFALVGAIGLSLLLSTINSMMALLPVLGTLWYWFGDELVAISHRGRGVLIYFVALNAVMFYVVPMVLPTKGWDTRLIGVELKTPLVRFIFPCVSCYYAFQYSLQVVCGPTDAECTDHIWSSILSMGSYAFGIEL